MKNFLIKIVRRFIVSWRFFLEKKDRKLLKKTMAQDGVYLGEIDAECIRNKRLARMLRYAQKQVPYYSDFQTSTKITPENALRELQSFSVLTRELIIKNDEKLKSKCAWLYPSGIMKTSGTTGIPLEFISSSPNGEISHQTFLYEFMTGKRVDSKRIISFGGAYLPEEVTKKNIFWKEEKGLYGSCLFSSFYILEENIPFYIKKLTELQPQIIRAYPSALLLFIDYCEQLHIRPDIAVQGIYVTSENVTKDQLEKISHFFDCGVYGQYGHSEACIFAFTLKNDTVYYCSPFYGFVEVLDADGKHVNVGETGYVTVTTFRNRAMPFIRYRMGDMAVYGGEKNGYVILSQLLGREKDYVLNEDNEKIFIIVGQFSECFLPAICHVKYWQAEQHERGKMHLRIVKKDVYTQQDEQEIIAVMQQNKIATTIEYVDDIPLTKAGKRKYIINSLY